MTSQEEITSTTETASEVFREKSTEIKKFSEMLKEWMTDMFDNPTAAKLSVTKMLDEYMEIVKLSSEFCQQSTPHEQRWVGINDNEVQLNMHVATT